MSLNKYRVHPQAGNGQRVASTPAEDRLRAGREGCRSPRGCRGICTLAVKGFEEAMLKLKPAAISGLSPALSAPCLQNQLEELGQPLPAFSPILLVQGRR